MSGRKGTTCYNHTYYASIQIRNSDCKICSHYRGENNTHILCTFKEEEVKIEDAIMDLDKAIKARRKEIPEKPVA